MKNRKSIWILSLAIAGGALAVSPMAALAKDRPAEPAKADAPDVEKQVKYASLPKEVKETLDKERDNHEVKSIFRVERDGKVFYRATIDTRGADTQIRIAEGGKLLSEAEIADTSNIKHVSHGKARPFSEMPTSGTHVEYDSLSGPVKAGIAKLVGGGKIKSVVRHGSGPSETFTAEFGNNERTWAAEVDAKGNLLHEYEDNADGKIVASYDRLPGAVKAAVAKNAGSARVAKVIQVTHNKDTFYRVEIVGGTGDARWISVNDDGKVTPYPEK